MRERSKQRHSKRWSGILRRRRFAFRGVLVLVGLAAAVAVAEVTIRIFDLKPPSLHGKVYLRAQSDPKATYLCYSSNPNGEFRPVPDVSRGEWGLTTSSVPPTQVPLSELKKTP